MDCNDTINISCDYFHHNADLFPIPRGPYCGHDYIYVESHPHGGYEVKRKTDKGDLVDDYGKVSVYQEAIDIVLEKRKEQAEKDCRAVTGNGRWSCD